MATLSKQADNSIGTAAATFNLKAVVQETGLKPDTLRAWERRYGVPNPSRTAGGHRLYSQDDIRLLKWLVARQEGGLSISRAVDLWRRLLDERKNPFAELPIESEEADSVKSRAIPVGATLSQMRNDWMAACMAFQEQSAENILNQAFAMYPPETVCFDLLQRALVQIGIDWYMGKATIQQEHFASALARRRVEALLVGTPPPTRSGRILVSCAPKEEHTFPPMLLTLLLRRRGWEALYLGANVPAIRMEATIDTVKPKLIVITAQTLYTAATLLPMAQMLVLKEVQVAFGGLVFTQYPALIKRIPGHYLGEHLENTPHAIEQILNTPRSEQTACPVNATYQKALSCFLEDKTRLEAVAGDLIRGMGMRSNAISQVNHQLSEQIAAALTLGDITLLGTTHETVEQLIVKQYQQLPPEHLHRLVKAYAAAARQTLDQQAGKIIVNWLDAILDNAND